MTNSAIYALGEVTVRFSGVLLIPLYTRYLTPEDYGILSVSNTFVAILAIFTGLNLEGAFARFYFDYNEPKKQQFLLSDIVYIQLGWAFVLSSILFVCGEGLFKGLKIEFYPYIALSIGLAITGILPKIVLTAYQVQEKAGKYALFTVLSFLITVGFVIFHVVLQKEGARGSLEGTLTGTLIVSFFAFLLLAKRWLVIRFDIGILKSALRYSLPTVPHLLLIWVMMGSDVFILQYFRPMSEVGIYSLGYTLGFAFFIVTGALARAWAPLLYRHAADANQKRMLSQVVTAMLVLMLLAVGCSMLFLKEAVMLITIEAFYDIILIIPWVALASIFHIIYISFVHILFFHKKTWTVSMLSAGAALINVILNFLFIPEFGMQAAAITTSAAYLLQMGLAYLIARKLLTLKYDMRKIFPAAVLCALLSISAFVFPDIENIWLSLSLKTALIFCMAGGFFYFGVISWKDIKVLKG